MDGAEASRHPPVAAASGRPRRVGGRGGPFVSGAARGASTGGRPLVRILVVVANIQGGP